LALIKQANVPVGAADEDCATTELILESPNAKQLKPIKAIAYLMALFQMVIGAFLL
jgi:hypothetical protein